MLRKAFGWMTGLLSLGSAMFFVMAVSDLVAGDSGTRAGVLAGLMVFFGGLTIATGVAALRLVRTAGSTARAAPPATRSTLAAQTTTSTEGIAVDIALEARILALASKSDGRITVTEVAVACAVPLETAETALDGLTQRGHADLEVTPGGDTVYVVRGFLSAEEKRESVDVSEHVRS